MKRNRSHHLALATKGLLAAVVGLAAFACAETERTTSDPGTQNISENTQTAPKSGDFDSAGRDEALVPEVSDAAYAAKRDQLLAETDQLLDGTEAEMASGAIAENSTGDVDRRPTLKNSPGLGFLEADATYQDEYFSEVLYAQVMEENAACSFEPNCSAAYLFKDVIFRVSADENGGNEKSVTPHELVPYSLAMTYARILDRYAEIDLERPPEIGDNREGLSTDGPYVGRASYPQTGVNDSGWIKVMQMELKNNSDTVQMIKLVTSPI